MYVASACRTEDADERTDPDTDSGVDGRSGAAAELDNGAVLFSLPRAETAILAAIWMPALKMAESLLIPSKNWTLLYRFPLQVFCRVILMEKFARRCRYGTA